MNDSQKLNGESVVLFNQVIKVPTNVADQLEIEHGAPVHLLIFTSRIDDVHIIIDYDNLSTEFFDELLNEKTSQSLYDYNEKDTS